MSISIVRQPRPWKRAMHGFGLDVPYTDHGAQKLAHASTAVNCSDDSGSAQALQQMLNDLGFGPLVVDGQIGNATFTALDAFAKATGAQYAKGSLPQGAVCGAVMAAWQAQQQQAQGPVTSPAGSTFSPGATFSMQPSAILASKPANAQQASMALVQPGPFGKAMAWWNSQSTTTKIAVAGGGIVLVGGIAYLLIGGGGGSQSATPNSLASALGFLVTHGPDSTTNPGRKRHRKNGMGRPSSHTSKSFHGKLSLERVKLDRGGYDRGGAYWGTGAPLYRYSSEYGEVDAYVRAATREAAKAKIRHEYPNVTFHRN